ncbi:hypothetical protein GCM10010388_05310 [Streptomyces mauvecolor]
MPEMHMGGPHTAGAHVAGAHMAGAHVLGTHGWSERNYPSGARAFGGRRPVIRKRDAKGKAIRTDLPAPGGVSASGGVRVRRRSRPPII